MSIYITATAQSPAIEWQKNYGSFYEDNGASVRQLADGSYILLGTVGSNDGDVSGKHGGYDFWLVKLNSTGIIQWQKCLGGSFHDSGSAFEQTTDGGFIIVGFTNSNDGDVSGLHGISYDTWVVKVDSVGNIQWQKCLGGGGDEEGSSIKQTLDGGYIMTGSTNSNDGDVSGNHGGGDVWVVKLDNTGNIQWQKCYGGGGDEIPYNLLQLTDGSYIFIGHTGSNDGDVSGNHGGGDVWIVKLDNTGNIQWQKCYGGTKNDIGYDIKQTPDGGFIFTGTSGSNNGDLTGNKGYNDLWVVKINNTGAIEWQKNYGGKYSEMGFSIKQTAEGGYIIGGQTESNNGDVSGNHGNLGNGFGGIDIWVLKINISGDIEWQKCLGGKGDEYSFDILQTNDGGYIIIGIAGYIDGDVTNNYDYADIWVVKLEAYTVNTVDYNTVNSNLVLYPNPTQDILYIRNAPQDVNTRIYNIYGACVMQTTGNKIDISILHPGLYSLMAGGQNIPFVKE